MRKVNQKHSKVIKKNQELKEENTVTFLSLNLEEIIYFSKKTLH